MAKRTMEWYDWIAYVLVAVGALNWGLVGMFGFNLVETIFGMGFLTKAVYFLVGISGLYALALIYKLAKSKR